MEFRSNFLRATWFAILVRFCLIFISHSILTIKIEFSLDEMKKKQYPQMYDEQTSRYQSLNVKFMGYIWETLWSLATRSHRMELNLI